MTNRISKIFEKKNSALIAYLTIGDPDLETSYRSIKTLAQAGADMIELGVPFTDPLADGPTIQKSSERALKNSFSMEDIFKLSKRLRDEGLNIPFVLMSYANPIYVYGFERFCQDAAAHGIDASLITDLPPEEACDYLRYAQQEKLGTVFLCSPTTSPQRLKIIDQASTAFVYYVARAGVTGTRSALPDDIQEKLQNIRKALKNKLCVGFGISTPEHARQLAPHTDGLIIGSVLVDLFENFSGDVLQEKIHVLITALKKSMCDV
jgi:tryptophan synthase alpha chain